MGSFQWGIILTYPQRAFLVYYLLAPAESRPASPSGYTGISLAGLLSSPTRVIPESLPSLTPTSTSQLAPACLREGARGGDPSND